GRELAAARHQQHVRRPQRAPKGLGIGGDERLLARLLLAQAPRQPAAEPVERVVESAHAPFGPDCPTMSCLCRTPRARSILGGLYRAQGKPPCARPSPSFPPISPIGAASANPPRARAAASW